MKIPVMIVTVSVLLILTLVGLAFIFIDLTGHKSFYYEITRDGVLHGAVVMDRYVTESKLVYKSRGVSPFSLGYPSYNSSLYLDKATKSPSKYFREDLGVKGQKTLTSLLQKHDVTDYLFLENPRFIRLENFPTGEKTMVYSPDDPMLVTALMERYNYWKKGTQYFEVMIPVASPYPVLRDKVSVRHVGEEYIPSMGRKTEAEIYQIGSKALSETKIEVSRNTHRILGMENPGSGVRFILADVREGPSKLSVFSLKNLPFVKAIGKAAFGGDDIVSSDYSGTLKDMASKKVLVPGETEPKEVFFESGNIVLAGSIWVPEGEGPFPPVLMIPGEGPRRSGERLFIRYLGSFLARSGYMAMTFDPPGQGKSQGSFNEMDDAVKIRNIQAAMKFLMSRDKIYGDKPVIVVSGTAANPALEAVSLGGTAVPMVLISPLDGFMPEKRVQGLSPLELKSFSVFTGSAGLDAGFMSQAAQEAVRHSSSVESDKNDVGYFMGTRLPVKGYRDFLSRRPYQTMVSSDGPLLVVMDSDDIFLDKKAADALRSAIFSKSPDSDIIVMAGIKDQGGRIELVDGKWKYLPGEALFLAIKNWIKRVNPEVPDGLGSEKGV